jgi:hypothetical protein
MALTDSAWMTASLILLSGTAVIGGITAYARLAEKNTPIDVGLLHGGAGITAALALLVASFVQGTSGVDTMPALGLLALTILAGIALYFVIRRRGVLPKSLILLHAALALSALHLLARGIPA